MSYLASLLLLLGSSLAFAATPQWVQIGDGVGISNGDNKPTTQTQVYIDNANLITDENGFSGYTIRFVLPAPVDGTHDDKTPFSYQIVETIIEYNCATSTARGKRTNFKSMEGVTLATSTDGWRDIPAGSGANAMLNAVKARVCH
jgi:hypothetical protein